MEKPLAPQTGAGTRMIVSKETDTAEIVIMIDTETEVGAIL